MSYRLDTRSSTLRDDFHSATGVWGKRYLHFKQPVYIHTQNGREDHAGREKKSCYINIVRACKGDKHWNPLSNTPQKRLSLLQFKCQFIMHHSKRVLPRYQHCHFYLYSVARHKPLYCLLEVLGSKAFLNDMLQSCVNIFQQQRITIWNLVITLQLLICHFDICALLACLLSYWVLDGGWVLVCYITMSCFLFVINVKCLYVLNTEDVLFFYSHHWCSWAEWQK